MKFPPNIIYRVHAVRRMFERNITEEAIKEILNNGLIIQKYLDDKPYPSYLIAGEYQDKSLHLVVAVDSVEQKMILITAYIPDLNEWELGFKVRRQK